MGKAVEIRGDLIREAMEITRAAAEREVIERAVEAYVAQNRKNRPRRSMFDLVGKIRLRDEYDYKALRAGDVEASEKHADTLDPIGKVRFRDDFDPRAGS